MNPDESSKFFLISTYWKESHSNLVDMNALKNLTPRSLADDISQTTFSLASASLLSFFLSSLRERTKVLSMCCTIFIHLCAVFYIYIHTSIFYTAILYIYIYIYTYTSIQCIYIYTYTYHIHIHLYIYINILYIYIHSIYVLYYIHTCQSVQYLN